MKKSVSLVEAGAMVHHSQQFLNKLINSEKLKVVKGEKGDTMIQVAELYSYFGPGNIQIEGLHSDKDLLLEKIEHLEDKLNYYKDHLLLGRKSRSYRSIEHSIDIPYCC